MQGRQAVKRSARETRNAQISLTATQKSTYPRLLGDVGGANARFVWQDVPGAALSDVGGWLCNEHHSLLDAIRHHLQVHPLPTLRACGIGIANPITGDQVRMTDHHWSLSIVDLQKSLGVARLVVINHFTAVALSLPRLAAQHLRHIGGGEAVAGAPLAIMGHGTGLACRGCFRRRRANS